MSALALDFYGDLIASTIAYQSVTREVLGRGFRAAIDGWVYGDMFAHDLPPGGDFHSPLPQPPSMPISAVSSATTQPEYPGSTSCPDIRASLRLLPTQLYFPGTAAHDPEFPSPLITNGRSWPKAAVREYHGCETLS